MPGKPRTTARKVAALESAVAVLFRQLDGITPEAHRKASENGTATSPWSACYRAGVAFVMAAGSLGDHSRKAAGIDGPGPIEAELGAETIRRMQTMLEPKDSATLPDPLRIAMRDVEDRLPAHAGIAEEVEWVGANLNRDTPDVEHAPSRLAMNLLLDLRTDPALRRDFWRSVLAKRMSPGDRNRKPSAFVDDADDGSETDRDRHQQELMTRLFGEGELGVGD